MFLQRSGTNRLRLKKKPTEMESFAISVHQKLPGGPMQCPAKAFQLRGRGRQKVLKKKQKKEDHVRKTRELGCSFGLVDKDVCANFHQ